MNVKKGIAIVAGVVAGLGLASFIGVKTYYGSHFLYDSKINNVNVSNLKVNQAQRKIEQKFKDTKITFTDKSGRTVASISELKFVDASKAKVSELHEQKEHKMTIGLTKLKTELPKELVRLNLNANAEDSVDAKLVRASKSKYVVTKEVYGNKIDYTKLQDATLKGIKAGQTKFKLSDFYIKPKVTHYNTKLTSTRDTLNKQLNTKVTIKVEDHKIAIPQETIQDSISVKGINSEPYLTLLNSLDDKYSNYNTSINFKAPSGKTVAVKNKADSGYGWYIKPEATYANIKALLMDKDKTSGTVEVTHAGTSYGEKTPFGGNYSVINLSNQYVYVYKGGKLSFKVPTITGKPTKGTVEQGGDGTDPGVHTIFSKLTHQTMKGLNDDGKTSYSSPTKWVTYFTRSGEAFHDASNWQSSSSYGKVSSPYKVGSHGCANLNTVNAKRVYDNTSIGDQVIVIGWLPRTAPSK